MPRRPWLRYLLAALLGFGGGYGAGALPGSVPTPPSVAVPATPPTADLEGRQFVHLLNAERAARSLPEVAWDDEAADWAGQNNAAQAKANRVGHYTDAWRSGFSEVAADGFTGPSDVLSGWRQSPGHWTILMDPASRHAGYARAGRWATADLRP